MTPLVASLDLSIFHLPQHARSPTSTIEVTGVASIATAVMDFIGNCDSTGHLVSELLRIAQREDRNFVMKEALLEHAVRQMNYCAYVAQAAAECSAAFAAVEGVMLHWQALAQQCQATMMSYVLASQLDEAADLIRQIALLGIAWPQLWMWFDTNQALIRDTSRIARQS